MADEKALTKSDLVAALKEAGVATQNDLKALRKQVKKDVEKIVHNQLTEFHHEMVKPELDKIGGRLTKLEIGQRDLKKKIDNLQWDTPSRQEFDELKKKAHRRHPPN